MKQHVADQRVIVKMFVDVMNVLHKLFSHDTFSYRLYGSETLTFIYENTII